MGKETDLLRYYKKYINLIETYRVKGKSYIENNREEIARENWSLLRKMSMLYTVVLMFSIVVFHVISDWDQYSMYVLIGTCIQILFTSYVYILGDDWINRYYFVQIIIESLSFTIAAMTICASVFAYSNYVGLFFPPVLICLGVLYIYPFSWVLIRITTYELIYVGLSAYFKTANAFYLDLTSSICAYIIVIIAAYSIYTLRIKDNNSKTELKKLSATDLLTGLSNKVNTEYLCEAYINDYGKTQGCALLVMDVDNFKMINDKLGHQSGDEVLRHVGKILKDSFRSNDIVGRIGGDEFMVLMKNISDRHIIKQKAEHTLVAIRNIFADDPSVKITCSIGIDISEADCVSFRQMFAKADKALYYAKEHGRNKALFYNDKADKILSQRRDII